MTRGLFLTLLALLSGLAVQATPGDARAQASRPAEMSAVAALSGEVGERLPAGISAIPAATASLRQSPAGLLPAYGLVMAAPAVRTGIDRARE